MIHILILGATLFASASSAYAIECSADLPAVRNGHWTYRIVDGRKCWYAGRTMLPRSSLRWANPSLINAQATMPPIDRADFIDPEDGTCCWPPVSNSDSFELRWRALLE
jgi:hypothetical protein